MVTLLVKYILCLCYFSLITTVGHVPFHIIKFCYISYLVEQSSVLPIFFVLWKLVTHFPLQINAKNKAEKKFNATLRSVGLDEDFVHSRGSRSASVHDYTDDYDDDFEDTAMRKQEETYTKRYDSEGSMSPDESWNMF